MKDAASTFGRVFGIPALLALLSSIGLISALVGDGVYDIVSWLGLGIPIIVILYAMTQRTA